MSADKIGRSCIAYNQLNLFVFIHKLLLCINNKAKEQEVFCKNFISDWYYT